MKIGSVVKIKSNVIYNTYMRDKTAKIFLLNINKQIKGIDSPSIAVLVPKQAIDLSIDNWKNVKNIVSTSIQLQHEIYWYYTKDIEIINE